MLKRAAMVAAIWTLAIASAGAATSTEPGIEFSPRNPLALEPVDATFERSACDRVWGMRPYEHGLQVVLVVERTGPDCGQQVAQSITLGALGPGVYMITVVRLGASGNEEMLAGRQLSVSPGAPPIVSSQALARVDWSGTWVVDGHPSTAVQVIHSRGVFDGTVTLLLLDFASDGSPEWLVVAAGGINGANHFGGPILRYARSGDASITSQPVGSAVARFRLRDGEAYAELELHGEDGPRNLVLRRFRWQRTAWGLPFLPN